MNRRGRLNLLQIVPGLIAGLTLLPVIVVASSLLTPSVEVWRHLWDTILPGMLRNTLLLVLGVGVGTAVLGTGLAWLVTAYDFPGRRTFQWMLVLPMAVPAYIMGFIYIATFDFAGPGGTGGHGDRQGQTGVPGQKRLNNGSFACSRGA